MHPNSFKGQNGNAPPPPASQQQQPPHPPAPAPAAPPVAEPSMGMDADPNFGMFSQEGGDVSYRLKILASNKRLLTFLQSAFNLDFNLNMDSTDVLDSFDFDSLLNADGFSFGNEGGLEVQ
jgi:hypothetical protein